MSSVRPLAVQDAGQYVAPAGGPGVGAFRGAAGTAGLLAALSALAIGRLRFAGVDLPAQVYRLHLFDSAGWIHWDPGWYGGSQVLGYSVLFDPLASVIGLYGVAALSAAIAAWCVHDLLSARWGRAGLTGTVVFTAGMIVPVAVGQLPFLLGQALGLLALRFARRQRAVSVGFSVLAPLASPVAGAFLALATAACVITGVRPRRNFIWVGAGTAASLGLTSALNLHTGAFPFYGGQLAGILALCGLGIALVGGRVPVLRAGLLLYGAAAVLLFIVPNALGGNFGRLGAEFGSALTATVALSANGWRRPVLGALLVPLMLWQWGPIMAVTRTTNDPSSQPSYYRGLLAYLDSAPGAGRLEIPLTARHWETAFVAPQVPLARGWERQLDIKDNPIFYQRGPLNSKSYHDWLINTGVTTVALPDVPLDTSARAEAALLRTSPAYLRPVWSDSHWQVWSVAGAPGLVSGPAYLSSVKPDGFTLQASPGNVLVRLRYGEGWTVTQGAACVERAPNDWTNVTVRTSGTISVSARMFPGPDSDC